MSIIRSFIYSKYKYKIRSFIYFELFLLNKKTCGALMSQGWVVPIKTLYILDMLEASVSVDFNIVIDITISLRMTATLEKYTQKYNHVLFIVYSIFLSLRTLSWKDVVTF